MLDSLEDASINIGCLRRRVAIGDHFIADIAFIDLCDFN